MQTEAVRLQPNRWNENHQEVVVHTTVGLYLPARIAVDIAKYLVANGSVTFYSETVDPTERDREVAYRACSIADTLCAEFKKREWTFDIPVPPEKGSKDGGVGKRPVETTG